MTDTLCEICREREATDIDTEDALPVCKKCKPKGS